MVFLRLAVTVALVLTMGGCTTIGPPELERDRFDYSAAIAESWKKVMLLNMVKLRYGDTPIFLEVGSIVNQYGLETELGGEVALRSGDLLGDGVLVEGKRKYLDRPTITYAPLTGKKFAKGLLTPIPPEVLFSLMQSGWSPEFLFRVCVTAINDLYNTTGRRKSAKQADIHFDLLLDNLEEIQEADGLGGRLVEYEGGTSIVFFRRNLGPELERRVVEIQSLLKLAPAKWEYRLAYGTTAATENEIAILTRSMLDIIAELAHYVQIPAEDILENRASPGFPEMHRTNTTPMFTVKNSAEKPQDAFLAVEYRDHWYYLQDTDYQSKRIFSFLLFLFSLAESGTPALAPALSLPTG